MLWPLLCFPYVSHAPHMRPFTCDAHESPTIPIHISCYGSPANRPAIEYVPPAPIGPAGGAGYRRHGSGGGERGKALRGLAGTPLGLVQSIDCTVPGRRMQTLQFSRLELIRAWTNGTGSTQRWPPGLSPATCVAAHGISPNVPGTRPDLNTPHTRTLRTLPPPSAAAQKRGWV